MSENREIKIDAILDGARIRFVHIQVCLLCFIVAMLDGFDTLSIGFVAPLVAEGLELTKQQMSYIFSSALFGILAGSLIFSLVGDRVGRRPVIIGACIFVGVFSLLTATATNFTEFAALRFFTGVGLGASLPNLYALVSDYAPVRRRAIMVTAMFVGFSVGATAGAALSNWISQSHGWQSIFIVGGVSPIVFGVALLIMLPESVRFLVRRNPSSPAAQRTVSRIDPSYEPVDTDILVDTSQSQRHVTPANLFEQNRGKVTTLFWAVYFTNLMTAYSLASWMPTILSDSGVPLDQAVWAASLTELGGVLGGLALANQIDRFGASYILSIIFSVATLTFFAIGISGSNFALLLALAFALGVCISGGQHTLNALSSSFYPSFVRSTGVGYSLASGRVGAIIGPIIIGSVLAQGYGRQGAFGAMAIMASFSFAVSFILVRNLKQIPEQ